ncbi:MAG: DUF3795 domain-containing protein [Candidatus Cloacimonetes bacterium]|nr:DUF3795 domain-containing protein [Candidatus Cloacimonadota bacterium]
MERHAAFCGLYCGACCSMIVNEQEQGVESALEMQTEPNEQPCKGCSADYQANCEFVVCNKQHQTASCAFCPEFPCAMITNFKDNEWEHHQVVLENLQRIKEIGIETWLTEQKKAWQCPSCGCRTQWYQTECTRCGGVISKRI